MKKNNISFCFPICLFLLIFNCILFENSKFCEADDRWIELELPFLYGSGDELPEHLYLDSETIEFDSANKQVTFWTKRIFKNERYDLSQCKVDIDRKKCMYLIYANELNNNKFKNPSWDILMPESAAERAVDYVCQMNGLPLVHPPKNERWKWVMSTDKYTLCMAIDTVQIDSANKCLKFISKSIYPNGRIVGHFWTCDYAKDRIGVDMRGYYEDYVIPDSIYEKVFLGAKSVLNLNF